MNHLQVPKEQHDFFVTNVLKLRTADSELRNTLGLDPDNEHDEHIIADARSAQESYDDELRGDEE